MGGLNLQLILRLSSIQLCAMHVPGSNRGAQGLVKFMLGDLPAPVADHSVPTIINLPRWYEGFYMARNIAPTCAEAILLGSLT